MSHGADPLCGQVLGGRYRVDARLGHGGFATVYRGRQINLGRPVAIKVLRPHPDLPIEGQRARLGREAVALSRLSAPTCVRIYDMGELPDGRPYLVQEFVAGTRLDLLLEGAGRLPGAQAVAIAVEVLDALADAHRCGVVHRDVKPENIMLLECGEGGERIKVLDFGIARLQARRDRHSFHTTTHHVLGTPQYMAPEQARQEPLGPATDLYAVGVLLYRMFEGREPFDDPNGYEILRQHVQEPVPEPAALPPRIWRVVRRALAKEPARRFASAEVMRLALIRAGADRPRLGVSRRVVALVAAATLLVGLCAGFAMARAVGPPPAIALSP